MKETMKKILEFRDERGWKPYHTPENLAKSISIEAAELIRFMLMKNWQMF